MKEKSVLIFDKPESCSDCILLNGADECTVLDEDTNFNTDSLEQLRQQYCPLRDLIDVERDLKKRIFDYVEKYFKREL